MNGLQPTPPPSADLLCATRLGREAPGVAVVVPAYKVAEGTEKKGKRKKVNVGDRA